MDTIPFLNEIVVGDAQQLLPRLPTKCARLGFADPPYWVGYRYGDKTDDSMDRFDPAWLVSEMMRIAEVFCITPGIANEYDYPRPTWRIAWRKPASTGRSELGGFNVWEPILVYGKNSKRFWQDEITAPGGQEFDAAFHPCPKPVLLLSRLISGFTDEGDVVVDPFAGSGTTAKAAKLLRRNYICFELDPYYVQQAQDRIAGTQPLLPQVPMIQMQLELAEPNGHHNDVTGAEG